MTTSAGRVAGVTVGVIEHAALIVVDGLRFLFDCLSVNDDIAAPIDSDVFGLDRNVTILVDSDGCFIVFVNDVLLSGKRHPLSRGIRDVLFDTQRFILVDLRRAILGHRKCLFAADFCRFIRTDRGIPL